MAEIEVSLGVDLEALFGCFFFSSAVEEVHWHTNTTSANYHRQPSSTAADAFGSINQRSCRRVATAAFERINNGNDLCIDFKSVLVLTPSIGLRYLLQVSILSSQLLVLFLRSFLTSALSLTTPLMLSWMDDHCS